MINLKYGRLIGIIALSTILGCMTVDKHPRTGRVQHIVVCWLKEPGNAQARARIIEVSRTFADIPGVLNVSVGQVLPGKRKIVDSTFDVALVITCKNEASMKAYLIHPKHKKAVEEIIGPLAKEIKVYDFTE